MHDQFFVCRPCRSRCSDEAFYFSPRNSRWNWADRFLISDVQISCFRSDQARYISYLHRALCPLSLLLFARPVTQLPVNLKVSSRPPACYQLPRYISWPKYGEVSCSRREKDYCGWMRYSAVVKSEESTFD